MANLKKFSGRTLVSAETSTVDLEKKDDNKADDSKTESTDTKLSVGDSDELCGWLSQVLERKTKSVKVITILTIIITIINTTNTTTFTIITIRSESVSNYIDYII